MIDQAAIRRLIPHAGTMCLLDAVIDWDSRHIHCRAHSHREPRHPLRRGDGHLDALHLIEYGAQAMAVHGGLTAAAHGAEDGAEHGAAPGLLVSVRAVRLEVERIDDIGAALDIRAERLIATAGGWLYGFRVSAGARALASGRVAVMPARDDNLHGR